MVSYVTDFSEVHDSSVLSADPEVVVCLYLQNIGYNVRNHTVQQSKDITTITVVTALQYGISVPV
jgi:hypothetical protein